MAIYLALAAYRCEVAGEPTESIDIQVRTFIDKSEGEIAAWLADEPPNTFENDQRQTVVWPFVTLLAVWPFDPEDVVDGNEVAGFIAGCYEFPKWAGLPWSANPPSPLAPADDVE